jgi:hypothetical protein
MSHLVAPLFDVSLSDALRAIEQVHQFIVECASENLLCRFARPSNDAGGWGCTFKRIEVKFPITDSRRRFVDATGTARVLISDSVESHKLVEIVNQAATLERLRDALHWAQSPESGLSDWRVQLCHPTTSSGADKQDQVDHDLVLRGPDGRLAVFEVSDVASKNDGNQKEEKDLVSLGVLAKGKGEDRFQIVDWPDRRLFLVVSNEWKTRLSRKTRAWLRPRTVKDCPVLPHLLYQLCECDRSTAIFEVCRGRGFGAVLLEEKCATDRNVATIFGTEH